MIVGVPKEIKLQENRIGLTPASAGEIIRAGGRVIVEHKAGLGIGIDDEDYLAVGAEVLGTAAQIYDQAELIVKVKEPQPSECALLKKGQTIFSYLHLAPDPKQTQLLLDSGVTAIAYETVTQEGGGLPLLTPMSQVAGRMSVQAGAHCLEASQGGSGVLLGGVPGVHPARVLVIGGGVVGTNAIRMAIGLEAYVTVIDKSLQRLQELDLQFGSQICTIYSTADALEELVTTSDLVIGAVLVPGAAAPKLVSRNMIRHMRPGSVLVDVAIDQGGCFESSRMTTHKEPTYIEDNIVHYCVGNMPGAVPKTSTFALNNATLPFVLNLVKSGVKSALLADPHFLNGLNIHEGKVTCEAVAAALDYVYVPPRDALV